jgi:hypothetical protein
MIDKLIYLMMFVITFLFGAIIATIYIEKNNSRKRLAKNIAYYLSEGNIFDEQILINIEYSILRKIDNMKKNIRIDKNGKAFLLPKGVL